MSRAKCHIIVFEKKDSGEINAVNPPAYLYLPDQEIGQVKKALEGAGFVKCESKDDAIKAARKNRAAR